MYFQVDNTPENLRKKKLVQEATECGNPRLILKVFSAQPVVTFDNTPVGSKSERTLEIFNPSATCLQLSVKLPPSDLGLELSWVERAVEPGSVTELLLWWSPKTATAQKISIQMADQRKGRYNVTIICKTKVNKSNNTKAKKKITTVFSLKKSPKLPKLKRLSPKNKMYIPVVGEGNTCASIFNMDGAYIQDMSAKFKRSPIQAVKPCFINANLPHPHLSSEDARGLRRDTYLVQDYDKENQNTNTPSPQAFRSSKMMNPSPFNSSSLLTAIENMGFTPSKESQKYGSKDSLNYFNDEKTSIFNLTVPESVHKSNKENNYTDLTTPKFKSTRNMKKGYTALSPDLTYNKDDTYSPLGLDFTPKQNKKSRSKSTFPNNIDSLIDGLAFTPVQASHERQHRVDEIGQNFKGHQEMSDRSTKIFEQINLVTIENHYIVEEKSDVTKVVTYSQNKTSTAEHSSKQSAECANMTHPIIDLCDESSNCSKIDNGIDVQQSRCPNIYVNGQEQYISNEKDFPAFTPLNENLNRTLESIHFNPKRCSTERKDCDHHSCKSTHSRVCKDLFIGNSPGEDMNLTFEKLSSDTYVKGESPFVAIVPNNQSSPYSSCGSPPVYFHPPSNSISHNQAQKQLFKERDRDFIQRVDIRNATKEKNSFSEVRDILEANMWQKTPPKPSSPTPLASIPEECTFVSEASIRDTSRRALCETFSINKTFEITKPSKPSLDSGRWMKTGRGEYKTTTSISRTVSKSTPKKSDILSHASQVFDSSYNYVNIKSVATTIDPFLAATYLYDERAYQELEEEFKVWLNYLLTPPSELDVDCSKVDLGKAWFESRGKAAPAPTKEQVSAKYHTSHRLDSLRKAAKTFVASTNMSEIFLKIANQVEKSFLSIRKDKNIHLDIGLQKIILNLVLCYNPLWLRIGLETLYGTKLPLSSNDDVVGLSHFIVERLLNPPSANKASSFDVLSKAYSENVKKFTLKKFLYLVYFLDQAKLNKVIPHDPCLFCRNAPFKESREILIQFAKEVLAGVGDITKHLRPTGYVVSHKQTYLHEFKYAVHNLAVDLKDGVRLTRLMEIILMKENLTSGLRTPAISRLQKQHNTKIALSALSNAGFQIVGDISANDIVDGHREKTLSLLWQLINKFRAPLFCTSALVIQKWWRKKSLKIQINKRIENKKQRHIFNAATRIQSWWKTILTRRQYLARLKLETEASITVQKYWRLWSCRNRYTEYRKSAILIQKWFRNALLIRSAKNLLMEKKLTRAATRIQRQYRKMKLRQQLPLNEDRDKFLQIKKSAICLQSTFRAYRAMKEARRVYVTLKISTIKIQRYFRAVVVCRQARKHYLQLKTSTLFIQRRFRANVSMQSCQSQYKEVKNATLKIQQYYRNWRLAKKVCRDYLRLKSAVVLVQQKYCAILAMRDARRHFLTLKQRATTLQKHFRAYLKMKSEREKYLRIQHSCILIQQYYRAYESMKAERKAYLELKAACTTIQTHYRCRLLMLRTRRDYVTLREATLTVQRQFRSLTIMKSCRTEYFKTYRAILSTQRIYRGKLEMIKCQRQFSSMRCASLKIQKWYRSLKLTRQTRQEYLSLKLNAEKMQQRYRRNNLAKKSRQEFINLKNACLIIQTHYRAKLAMRHEKSMYELIKSSVYKIQIHYRAYVNMKDERQRYLGLKESTLTIQRCYRNYLLTKKIQNSYLTLKRTAIFLQRKYRALLVMRHCRDCYLNQKRSVGLIQMHFRAYLQMKKDRNEYLDKKKAIVAIQKYYRGWLLTKTDSERYLEMKKACLVIQAHFRANTKMIMERSKYSLIRKSVIVIQRNYRAIVTMRKVRTEYLKYYRSVLAVQRRFRANQLMLAEKNKFCSVRSAAIFIQQTYRAYAVMKVLRTEYLRQYRAVLVIQRFFRAKKQMEICRDSYKLSCSSIVKIQKWYRSILSMREAKSFYTLVRKSVITIQRRYRELILARSCRKSYVRLRNACIVVQNRYRAKKSMQMLSSYYKRQQLAAITIQTKYKAYRHMKIQKEEYSRTVDSIRTIQRMWRSYVLTKTTRTDYLMLKQTVLFVQNKYRAKLKMMKCMQTYQQTKTSTVTIQKFFRSYTIMKTYHQYYLRLRISVLTIQSIYRMKLARRNYLNKISAAIKIQSFYRMHVARRQFHSMRRAAIIIQTHFRSLMVGRAIRERYINTRLTIIKLQSLFRQWILMRRYLRIRRSVLFIQTTYRTKLKLEAEKRKGAIEVAAATKIQSCWRGYMERIWYNRIKSASVKSQRQWRCLISLREERNACRLLHYSAVRLQAAVRGWLARRALSQMLRERAAEAATKAAVVIQKHWRGHRVRARETEAGGGAASLRKRWRDGALQSSQLTLAERSQDAMEVLGQFRDVASVIRAFKTLDYVTSVYPMMYGSKATAVPLIGRLVLYMKSTNRSVSTLETLQLGASVLLNMTKYSPTAHYVYKVDHLDTILTLMLRWCDKDNLLSRLFCTLLWMFGKYEDIQKELSSILNSGKPYSILSDVRSLLMRKRRMNNKRRNARTSLPAHSNMSQLSRSFNDSSFVMRQSMTPMRGAANLLQTHLPTTEPDYGIQRTDRPKIFADEIQAIEAVFFKFNLPLNIIPDN